MSGIPTFFRAAAWNYSAGDVGSVWRGRWHPDRKRAEAQAVRWKLERDDPPDEVWIEALGDGGAVRVATLVVLGDVA